MAHPTGFEPVTSAFGARHLSAKSLYLLARTHTKHHERIGNITALSGNNPEAIWTCAYCFRNFILMIRVVMAIVFEQCRNTGGKKV